MKDILIIALTLGFALLEVVEVTAFESFFCEILEKGKEKLRFLTIWVSIILFEVLLYSWLPGRLGLILTFFDGGIELIDGALYSNFAIIMFAQAVGLILGLVKNIWGAIRKKNKFTFKLFVLYLVFIAIFGFLAQEFWENEQVVSFDGYHVIVVIALTVLSILVLKLFRGYYSVPKSSQSSASPNEEQYKKLLEERNRLRNANDYTAEIELLTKATGSDFAPVQKAMVWKYLGDANEKLDNYQRAAECYTIALKIVPGDNTATNRLKMANERLGR